MLTRRGSLPFLIVLLLAGQPALADNAVEGLAISTSRPSGLTGMPQTAPPLPSPQSPTAAPAKTSTSTPSTAAPTASAPSQSKIEASPGIGLGHISVAPNPSSPTPGVIWEITPYGSYSVSCYSYANPPPGNIVNCVNIPPGQLVDNGLCNLSGNPPPVTVCGQTILPDLSQMIGMRPLQMPPPFVPDNIFPRCVSLNKGFGWTFDISAVTCQKMKCPDSKADICGQSIALPGGATVGSQVIVPIADNLLAQPVSGDPPSVTAQCVYDQANGVHYETGSADMPACDIFACPAAHFTLCGIDIAIKGGAASGSRFTMAMPAPFHPDPFAVSCQAEITGEAPVYNITDTSQVSCQ